MREAKSTHETGKAAAVRRDDEAGLVERARTGDEDAIRTLVQHHNRRLYRVTRAVLGDDIEAEDAVQEAYLRAFTRLDGFRGDAAFGTWLTRIALNEALQRLRGRRRALPAREETAAANMAPGAEIIAFPGPGPVPDPESAAARRQLRELIEAAVERLPAPMRLVFILRDIEEMSIAETAAQLGLKEATVKTRLHRARKLLRGTLDAEIAATLTGAFPFGGARCAGMAERVVAGLARRANSPEARP